MVRSSVYVWRMMCAGVIAALVLGACGTGDFTNLTTEKPIVTAPEGLSLSVNPTTLSANFGVEIKALPAEQFAQGEVEAAWKTAATALPGYIRLASAVFTLRTNGTAPEQSFLSIVVPAELADTALDLYMWDGKAWSFLPAQNRGGQLVAEVTQIPTAVALFEAAYLPPFTLTTIEPGQTVEPAFASTVNGVLAGGVVAQTDGTLTGQMPALDLTQPYAVYPAVRNYTDQGLSPEVLNGILNNADVRTKHLDTLVSFVVSSNYDGVALDYQGVTAELAPAYAQFVYDLAQALHAQNKSLLVQVEAPTRNGDAFNTGGYDWRALGAAADTLLIPVSADPRAFGDGTAAKLLAWATGEVSRSRLRLLTSASNISSNADGQFATLSQSAALAPLGSAALNTDAADTDPLIITGETVTAALSGQAQTLTYDSSAYAATYTYADAEGKTHTVWFTTADTLRQRLALAEKYRLGGVAVSDLAANIDRGLGKAVAEYKANVDAAVQQQAALLWTVTSGGSVLSVATSQPGQPYLYVASAPGDYQISADLQNGETVPLGSVAIQVAEITATPSPSPTAVRSVNNVNTGGGSGSGATPVPTTKPSSGGGVFVPPPPIGAGTFELGGQVPGFIGHPDLMKQAGMKWVKFQTRSGGADLVAAGHAAGFKVLLSVIGDKSRVTDPAYWDEYAAWVGGLAASGADAIEVWNEPNIDHEWPEGQISAATYAQLLAKAYNAIKGANGGTIVISGGPAPTGAEAAFPGRVMNDDRFLRELAAAGGANYMDCVGIHYNEGIVSAYQTSGDPRDSFYSRYYGSMVDLYWGAFGGTRPLCFTELGYLTPEGYGDLPGWFGWAANTSVAEQAQWLAEAASLSGSNGKVRLMTIWNVDFTMWGGDPQAGYAIVRPGGGCPACAALDAVMP